MTPTYKKLLRELKLDAVFGLDAETYWASDYTLRTLATTEYVCDPRFEGQIVSIQKDSWTKPKVLEWKEFVRWSKAIDWSRTGMLAHHAHFDGFVFQRHAGFEPKFHFDTLSMARAVLPVCYQRELPQLKHAGTLPLFQQRRLAMRRGFDDALFVDAAGRISEGSTWNIALLAGTEVVWPRAEALRGTAEQLLIAGLEQLGQAQAWREVPLDALGGFRAAVACNATGLWPLARIGDCRFADSEALLRQLRHALAQTPWRPL